MNRARSSWWPALMLPVFGLLTAHAETPTPAVAGERFVAVVVGITSYANLPDEVELDHARGNARSVADALQASAHYDAVYLLMDKEATKANISATIHDKVPQQVTDQSTLLVYFVGHGDGAGAGSPALLAHDSTRALAHEDGWLITDFADYLRQSTMARNLIVVTDAIHSANLDGVPFHGPSADQWPDLGPHALVISSSMRESPAGDGVFAPAFADAVSGAADEDADGRVTSKELVAYLQERLKDSGQIPMAAGDVSDQLILARGVTPGMTVGATAEPAFNPAKDSYPLHAAKFVFRDGINQTVQCPGKDQIVACDPSCYVRNFDSGICKISAIVGGQEVRGKTLVLLDGRYDCGLRSDNTLSCSPPPPGAATSP